MSKKIIFAVIIGMSSLVHASGLKELLSEYQQQLSGLDDIITQLVVNKNTYFKNIKSEVVLKQGNQDNQKRGFSLEGEVSILLPVADLDGNPEADPNGMQHVKYYNTERTNLSGLFYQQMEGAQQIITDFKENEDKDEQSKISVGVELMMAYKVLEMILDKMKKDNIF